MFSKFINSINIKSVKNYLQLSSICLKDYTQTKVNVSEDLTQLDWKNNEV
jgi:hypothetical protein